MAPDTSKVIKRKPRVYIAAPYSNGYLLDNLENAIIAGETIVRHGGVPYIPHQNVLHDFIFRHPPDFWYNLDLEWLVVCDALYRVPGFSPGSDNEETFALEHGIQIFYNYDVFEHWLKHEWYRTEK